jgi:hypothetical protein
MVVRADDQSKGTGLTSPEEVYEARPTKRARRTKSQLGDLETALYQLVQSDPPMTVRQVFYRAVSAKLVPKTEQAYKNDVGRLLGKMRREERLPWDWIADSTRWQRKPLTFNSVDEAVRHTAECYRRAVWDDQNVYVEVWTEKDALAGVLSPITSSWDVPLMVSKGFASLTYLYEAAQTIKSQGKPAFLYYFGDHDPSGIHIDRDIEAKLREMAPDCRITFERVAVRPEQIDLWSLPTRPTKKTDGRSKSFKGESVEVDAIPPAQLRSLVTDCIIRHIDQRRLSILRTAEREERQLLGSICEQLRTRGRGREAGA